MHQVMINVPDEAYDAAAKRAEREGYSSTEVFLSDLVVSSVTPDEDDYDHLFTSEKIVEIRAAATEARTGNNISLEQVTEHFSAKRKAWLENHPV